MAKKTYVSPGIMLLAADPGTTDVPFSQFDPDKPKGNNAKETEFDDEEFDTGWEY
ncbi:hypothetical protein JCM15640A_20460 [Hoylesella timonensis 4401737 = DSM 22865 = JCM 15640]|uniref:hypothetical protein n=1 Tax=Hoylesella timonensis TaxID=386414 RepID=UPI000407F69F|nr:hypothetical protein [Hoylesella timonensis]